MRKKEEIIISYSEGDCGGFIGHKSIHIISSSNSLNKQHNSVSITHIEKYEMISHSDFCNICFKFIHVTERK